MPSPDRDLRRAIDLADQTTLRTLARSVYGELCCQRQVTQAAIKEARDDCLASMDDIDSFTRAVALVLEQTALDSVAERVIGVMARALVLVAEGNRETPIGARPAMGATTSTTPS